MSFESDCHISVYVVYDYMKYDMWLRCRLTVIVVFVYMKYDTSLIKLNVNIL